MKVVCVHSDSSSAFARFFLILIEDEGIFAKLRSHTPSQGCSSGSGHYTPSVKAALQRAEILVVDTKLGRDPITDPG